MFTHPDRLGQLAREHHHDMLAQASQRSLRSQSGSRSPAAPNAAARITRRLAAAIGMARVMVFEDGGHPLACPRPPTHHLSEPVARVDQAVPAAGNSRA